MATFDDRTALDVHTINRDNVSIVGEWLRKPGGVLRILALDELCNQHTHGVSITTLKSGHGLLLLYRNGQKSCTKFPWCTHYGSLLAWYYSAESAAMLPHSLRFCALLAYADQGCVKVAFLVATTP